MKLCSRPLRLWRVALRMAMYGVLGVAATGCAGFGYRDAIEDLAGFKPLPEAAQVRHAPGAERYARRVATLLPAATAQVEALHYRRFRSPPVVYVCNDDACFDRFVAPRYNYTAAVIYDNRLLLAARLFDREPHRLTPILLHELSHLHLGQSRGHYSMSLPVWFHEGLAALVAAGGGADLVTDAEAWTAAAGARHFLPDEQHLPWMRKVAENWSLPISLFYRQALLYMRDLQARDEGAFRQLLARVQDGENFDTAFAHAYQVNPARSALAFFRQLNCAAPPVATMQCGDSAACCAIHPPHPAHSREPEEPKP